MCAASNHEGNQPLTAWLWLYFFFLRMKDYWVTKGWVALTFLGVTRKPIEQWTQHTLVVCFVHEGERIYSFFIIGNIILCNESLQGALSFIAHIGCPTIAMFDLNLHSWQRNLWNIHILRNAMNHDVLDGYDRFLPKTFARSTSSHKRKIHQPVRVTAVFRDDL